MITLSNVRLLVFDLDDTLCLERDFLVGGFRAVAESLSRQFNANPAELFDRLMSLHHDGRRDKFQAVLSELTADLAEDDVQTLVHIYRTGHRTLELTDDADRILTRIRNTPITSAVLTDGPLEGQRTKVKLLDLHNRVDAVLYTAELGPEYTKPSPKGFQHLAEQFKIPSPHCVYIADNEKKDFIGPNQLQWQTVKIERPDSVYSHYKSSSPTHAPQYTITTFDELNFA